MATTQQNCPKCGGNDLRPAGVLRRNVSPLALHFGGLIFSLLLSGSRKRQVRCAACDEVFEHSTRLSKLARIVLLFVFLLILLSVLATVFLPDPGYGK